MLEVHTHIRLFPGYNSDEHQTSEAVMGSGAEIQVIAKVIAITKLRPLCSVRWDPHSLPAHRRFQSTYLDFLTDHMSQFPKSSAGRATWTHQIKLWWIMIKI